MQQVGWSQFPALRPFHNCCQRSVEHLRARVSYTPSPAIDARLLADNLHLEEMHLVPLRYARINKDRRLPLYPLQIAHQYLAQRGKKRVSWREQHRVLVLGSLLDGFVAGQLTVLRRWHTVA